MNIIKRATLKAFWEKHPETREPLVAWFNTVRRAEWSCTADVLAAYPKAKILNAERVRFAIRGGNYRLIAAFKFTANIAWVKFVGTHSEYDRIDALTVDDH